MSQNEIHASNKQNEQNAHTNTNSARRNEVNTNTKYLHANQLTEHKIIKILTSYMQTIQKCLVTLYS